MDIGVIGAGMMGRNHVRIYSELKPVNSVYVYDLNQNQASLIAGQNNAEVALSIPDLLKKVDAVSLCVPTPLHYQAALDIIETGMNTLIEKPICLTSSQGPIVEDYASIGANTTILPGIIIGEGSLVASGSIVTRDVPANVLAIGSPARIKPLPENMVKR